jgi:hypothetical protein
MKNLGEMVFKGRKLNKRNRVDAIRGWGRALLQVGAMSSECDGLRGRCDRQSKDIQEFRTTLDKTTADWKQACNLHKDRADKAMVRADEVAKSAELFYANVENLLKGESARPMQREKFPILTQLETLHADCEQATEELLATRKEVNHTHAFYIVALIVFGCSLFVAGSYVSPAKSWPIVQYFFH